MACWIQTSPPPSAAGSILFMLLPLAVGYYFLIIRPMQRHRRQQEDMRQGVKPGDRILTTGGLHGVVTKLRDDRVILRISDGVQVELARSGIAAVLTEPKTD